MKLYLSYVIVLVSTLCFAQDTLETEWIRIESSSLPSGNAEAWCVDGSSPNQLYWGVNKDAPGLFEYMNAYTYHLDDDNNILWMDTSVTGEFAQQSYVLAATDSMIFLGGRTCTAAGLDSCNALVFAVDLLGNTQWIFEWDGAHKYEEIDGLVPRDDGIYITGWTASNNEAVDINLIKLDYNGNLLWQNQWGSGLQRDDRQDGHIVVDDSMIYLCGVYDSSPGLGWEGRSLLAKFNKSDGSLADTTLFGRQDSWLNAEDALGMTSDGIFLYLTGYTTTATNDWDLFVTKYDKDLNQIWHTVWGASPNADVARSIRVADNGDIYVAGTTRSYGNGNEEAVLIKFDGNGFPLWYKTWGAWNDDHVLDFHLMDTTAIYISGKTNSFHPNQKWEAFLLKIGMSSLSRINELSQGASVHIYPNPSEGEFKLIANITIDKIRIYNLQGNLIAMQQAINDQEVLINLLDQPSGSYLLDVSLDGISRTYRIFKK